MSWCRIDESDGAWICVVDVDVGLMCDEEWKLREMDLVYIDVFLLPSSDPEVSSYDGSNHATLTNASTMMMKHQYITFSVRFRIGFDRLVALLHRKVDPFEFSAAVFATVTDRVPSCSI